MTATGTSERNDTVGFARADPAAGTTTLELPGEATFWQTVNIAPDKVALPLEARARLGISSVLLLFVALVFMMPACLISSAALHEPTQLMHPGMLPIVAIFSLLGLCMSGSFLTLVADTIAATPRLVITPEGIIDRRALDRMIAWSEVAHARLRYTRGGFGAVTLSLRHEIAARHNPLRLGVFSFAWRRRPDELHVPVLNLDVNGRLLALSIVSLAKAHGSVVETLEPFTGHDPLRHL